MKRILYHVIVISMLFVTGCGGCSEHSGGSLEKFLLLFLFNDNDVSVNTGEEVLFDADDFPGLRSAITDPMHARYRWHFGDDRGPVAEARSTTYTFTNPGVYQVRLEVTPAVRTGTGDDPAEEYDDSWSFNESATAVFTRSVTVTGQGPRLVPHVSARPVLSLGFDDTIGDGSALPHAVAWKDGSAGAFVPGMSGSAVDLSGGKALVIDSSTLLCGRGEFTISFWAKKKDASRETNCLLWQGTRNPTQPVMRYLLIKSAAGENSVENIKVYTFMDAGGQETRAYNLEYDANWHHYAFTFSAAGHAAAVYRDGKKCVEAAVAGNISTAATTPIYIGYGSDQDGDMSFNGCIDDLRIYDCALTEQQLTGGFDVMHADFHGHIRQWVLVTVPEEVTSGPGNRLYAEIGGGGLLLPLVLVDNKTGLAAREKFLLNNEALPGSDSDYVLTVQLRDASGGVMYEHRESFRKTYDAIPEVGIDENNAIRVNGELFFPVTPFCESGSTSSVFRKIDEWIDNGRVNAMFGQGFTPRVYTIEQYRRYLDYVLPKSVRYIGPTMWEGAGNMINSGEGHYPFGRCSDLTKLKAYVEAFRDHKSVMMWNWGDEPDLYGVTAHSLRGWAYTCHRLDPQHLVTAGFMGHTYVYDATSYRVSDRRTYTLGYNSQLFGKRRSAADVVAIDNYPFCSVSAEHPDTMNRLGTMLDNVRDENLNLVPIMSAVETSDAKNTSDDLPETHPTPWHPTVDQLRMIAWFNVVHGAKGLIWFHYFGIHGIENYDYMATFVGLMKQLAPVVLGPPVEDRAVTVACGAPGGRVDTMLRRYNGRWYLFAVRVSEFAVQPNTLPDPPPAADNYPVTATFNLGPGISGTARDYEGSRAPVSVTEGAFTDTFEPFAVHIYEIQP